MPVGPNIFVRRVAYPRNGVVEIAELRIERPHRIAPAGPILKPANSEMPPNADSQSPFRGQSKYGLRPMKKQLQAERGAHSILNPRHINRPQKVAAVALSGNNAIKTSMGNSKQGCAARPHVESERSIGACGERDIPWPWRVRWRRAARHYGAETRSDAVFMIQPIIRHDDGAPLLPHLGSGRNRRLVEREGAIGERIRPKNRTSGSPRVAV